MWAQSRAMDEDLKMKVPGNRACEEFTQKGFFLAAMASALHYQGTLTSEVRTPQPFLFYMPRPFPHKEDNVS